MTPAAKHGDPQLGIDIHLCEVPPSPTPVPLPTPRMSIVFDPFDYLPILGATVYVCGMRRANAGTNGIAFHIPPGFPFAPEPPPEKDDEIFMGSATVLADGEPFTYLALPVLSCQVVGMPSVPRKVKKDPPKMRLLPTTVNLAIPTSVFVGGPPTISMSIVMAKAGFAALGKLAKSGLFKRIRQKVFRHMKPGSLKCSVLRAEPVNILTGDVAVEQLDFAVPGRLPLRWVRSYSSGQSREGACGFGWETPSDGRLEIDQDGSVLMQYPEVGPLSFERLPLGKGDSASELELLDGARLTDCGDMYEVRTKEDRVYCFPKHSTSTRTDGVREIALERICDLCGNWLRFERHGRELYALQLSDGRRLEILHGTDGRIAGLAMHLPNRALPHVFVRYEYEATGDLAVALDARNQPYAFAYDEAHRMVRHTDRNGLSFYYAFDARGRVEHAWGDGGLYDYRFEYNDTLSERRITNSLGYVSTVKLDDRGLPISEIDPLGGITSYLYDEAGRTVAVVDPAGRRTQYQYDVSGNLLKLTRPDDTCVTTVYGPHHKPIETTDPNGGEWRHAWDERGMLIESKTPLGHASRYEYDQHGTLIGFVDSRGARTEVLRDNLGLIGRINDAEGHTRQFLHDHLGNLTAFIDSLGRETQYEYDPNGRLLKTRLPSGAWVRRAYDGEGHVIQQVDENGAKTEFRYYGLGNIARCIQANGHDVEYLYNTEEQLVGVRNQRGETYQLKRDALGRVVEEIDYWGQSRRYERDAGGYLLAAVDPLNRRIQYETDLMGRITRKLMPDGLEETFTYDSIGNVVATQNAHVTVTRQFDIDGQLTREVQLLATEAPFIVENSYDACGNRVARRTSLGNIIEFEFDSLNRTRSVRINTRTRIEMERDAEGYVIHEVLAPTLQRRFCYDDYGCLANQVAEVSGAQIFATRYQYDAVGQLTSRIDDRYGSDHYRYDPVGRLLEHIDPHSAVTRFQPDAAGDQMSTRITGEQHRAWWREGEFNGTHFRYDRAGNLVERRDFERHLRLFWDANRRLAESHSNGTSTRYTYDAEGRRVLKQTGSRRTRFFWDGDGLLGESTALADRREYVYYPLTFQPLARIDSSDHGAQVLFFYNDPNGCPTRLSSETGAVLWAASHTPFGAISSLHEAACDNPLRFQGQYEDAETGLCYNRHRYYDPGVGAYISIDPIRLRGGANLYAYVNGNPFLWADPLGLNCQAALKSIDEQLARKGAAEVEGASRAEAEEILLALITRPGEPGRYRNTTNQIKPTQIVTKMVDGKPTKVEVPVPKGEWSDWLPGDEWNPAGRGAMEREGTYHFDPYNPDAKLGDHALRANHWQVHNYDGKIIRIFFPGEP